MLHTLPTDCLFEIFSLLDVVQSSRLSRVCKTFHLALNDDALFQQICIKQHLQRLKTDDITWKQLYIRCDLRWMRTIYTAPREVKIELDRERYVFAGNAVLPFAHEIVKRVDVIVEMADTELGNCLVINRGGYHVIPLLFRGYHVALEFQQGELKWVSSNRDEITQLLQFMPLPSRPKELLEPHFGFRLL
eukprot:TRINITY_DN11373_c0_g1_i1.p1 TRINITY_DN11373_c0_g1~~TRINITY_DN11373_c0_g1_i1.p1  ORF type:complete len:190 (+),score=47.30 TRINITY_DN11373_c0_g1_i1:75-644(+)